MELNTIKPATGAKHAKRRVGRGIGSGLGKRRPARVTTASIRAPAAITRSASKAARCRCNAACPSAASRFRMR